MKRLTVTGYAHNGKATRITLRFDDKGNLLNPRSAAKNGMVGWGEWQSSEKIPSHFGHCWWVSTAGHGGYILVTPIKGLPFKEPALEVEHSFGTVYVYEFEEDCDWALLEYWDELVRQHAFNKQNNWRAERGESPQTAVEYWSETILPCVRRWSPSMLEREQASNSTTNSTLE